MMRSSLVCHYLSFDRISEAMCLVNTQPDILLSMAHCLIPEHTEEGSKVYHVARNRLSHPQLCILMQAQ